MLLHRPSSSFLLLVAVSYFVVVASFTTQRPLVVTNHAAPTSRRQVAALTSVSSAPSLATPGTARRLGILSERRWNFNDGQAPWGMKKNAEIWNGRVAQMAFVLVFLQELIQGKGVIQGFQDGDFVNIAGVGSFAITVLGLTAFLAIKGVDDYTKKDVEGL